MGNKYPRRDPLKLAQAGDEDCLEEILGNVCAPVFDLALHLFGPKEAEGSAIAALRVLAQVIRSTEPLPSEEPLTVAARALTEAAPDTAPGEGGVASDLSPVRRRALVCALALDLTGQDLAYALNCTATEAQSHAQAAIEELGTSAESIRGRLDAFASKTPMPRGMVDHALQN